MSTPYEVGDNVAYINLEGEVLRVRRATVENIEHVADNRFEVTTEFGKETVDRDGEGALVLPLDLELWQEFERQGDDYTVSETARDLQQELDVEMPSQDLDSGRDGV